MAMPSTTYTQKTVNILYGFITFEILAYIFGIIAHVAPIVVGRDPWAAGAEVVIILALIWGILASRKHSLNAVGYLVKAQLIALGITLLGLFIVIRTLTPETAPNLVLHGTVTVVLLTSLAIVLYRRK